MKGEGGPLSLPPGLLALLLGLPSSSLTLSSVLGGPEPQFPLPGTPSAVGGPSSSLPWPGRWESLWGRGSWLLGFPQPLASRKFALGEGNLAPFSQTKVQGRRLGTPADLYLLFRFGVQASEAQKATPGQGGDQSEALEGGGGRSASSQDGFGPPGCGAVGRGLSGRLSSPGWLCVPGGCGLGTEP